MKLALKLRQVRKAGEQEDACPPHEDLGPAVFRMTALLQEAMSGGVATDLGKLLKALDDNRDEIQAGIIAWIHLIEVIVQGAERGQRKGGGPRKKSQVKAAVFRILNNDKARLPGIPTYLYPLVMDFVVEWMVEALVQVENDYALWNSREEDPSRPIADFVNWLMRALARIWQPFVGYLITAYTTMKYYQPLDPELEKAVEGVENVGLADKTTLLRSGVDLLDFVGKHGKQVIAGVKLIFEAVHLAESFLELDGPCKKQYAHDLIVATLERLGFPVGSGLFGIIAGVFIDAGIDAAWSIFSMRAPETFKHRHKSSGAVNSVGAPSGFISSRPPEVLQL